MTGATRALRFVASLALMVVAAVIVPWGLLVAARARFGGGSPLAGVPGPVDWEWSSIRRALTEQLTEDTIADVVIRASLVVAWVAAVVFVVTVVAEAAHMVRHGGLPMPEVRWLGWSQSGARVVATGLLVVVPMLTSASRATARDALVPAPSSAAAAERAPTDDVQLVADRSAGLDDEVERPAAAPAAGTATYVVRAGDSVFAIAERLAGPDTRAVHAFAERLLERNLGRVMPDGRRFDNAAFIDVGWVLDLPPLPAGGEPAAPTARSPVHVVERGETLWSIADDELGDADRWPEIFDVNRGRTFDDGRTLDDPSLIQPGWELDLPADPAPPEPDVVEPEIENPSPAEPVPPEPDVVERVPDTADGTGVGEVAADVDAPGAEHLVARPNNSWVDAPAISEPAPVVAGPSDGGAPRPASPASASSASAHDEGVQLLTLGRAAMLCGGALTLLAVRRRKQLRRARPRSRVPDPSVEVARTERALRSIDPGDRLRRVDVAVRAAAGALVESGARVEAVVVGDDGSIVLHATGPATLDTPWIAESPSRWQLAGAVPVELLAESARRVGAPCPALVQLGRTTDDRDLFVDLEALGAIEVGGPGDQADAIVRAVAAMLAGSVLAEVTTLVGVGVDDAAFLGHRHHVPARDVADAFGRAGDALGRTATSGCSTFELRARATGGETWEPAVVLVGAAAGTVTPPADRTGLAVVSASPIHGPSSRLAPDGDAWMLRPLGVRCVPVGLTPADLGSLAALVASADVDPVVDDQIAEPAPARLRVDSDDDLTLAPDPEDPDDSTDPDDAGDPDSSEDSGDPGGELAPVTPPVAPTPGVVVAAVSPLLVRLLGPVTITAADGREASFEKSKARELVAWLATHRQRSTRTGARTALWELDVRNATFANVVSEARRTLARLVEPPEGEEWIGRTLTEALPLHPLVRTDADLVRDALAAARVQPPEQAIATLRPAVQLVVGLPFEGTGYLWPEAEGIASQLVLLATSATSELAAHCLEMGDIDGVFDATARGLQVLPGHEELIGLRMRAHAGAGDHAGVRHEWEQYERVITADPWSDGEPSPALIELRRHLLAGR